MSSLLPTLVGRGPHLVLTQPGGLALALPVQIVALTGMTWLADSLGAFIEDICPNNRQLAIGLGGEES